ncbi:unnamed protein product [Closterium sp. Yama58-4]|nr:unnamed protein product [Closterium sp. Yama58-4]
MLLARLGRASSSSCRALGARGGFLPAVCLGAHGGFLSWGTRARPRPVRRVALGDPRAAPAAPSVVASPRHPVAPPWGAARDPPLPRRQSRRPAGAARGSRFPVAPSKGAARDPPLPLRGALGSRARPLAAPWWRPGGRAPSPSPSPALLPPFRPF